MRQKRASRRAHDPAQAVTPRTPESEAARQARRAEHVRQHALHDPKTLALLDQARRVHDGEECE